MRVLCVGLICWATALGFALGLEKADSVIEGAFEELAKDEASIVVQTTVDGEAVKRTYVLRQVTDANEKQVTDPQALETARALAKGDKLTGLWEDKNGRLLILAVYKVGTEVKLTTRQASTPMLGRLQKITADEVQLERGEQQYVVFPRADVVKIEVVAKKKGIEPKLRDNKGVSVKKDKAGTEELTVDPFPGEKK